MADSLINSQHKNKACGIILCVVFLISGFDAHAQYQIVADTTSTSPRFGQIFILGDFENQIYQNRQSDYFKSIMTVKVKGASMSVLGGYTHTNSQLTFIPRFSPDPTVTYEVNFHLPNESKVLNSFFVFSRPFSISNLIKISPNNTLPANALRIYLHFDKPMGLQNPFDFIKLVDQTKTIVKDAFVEFDHGLWNKNRTRLTLLFHPGRIKQGVGPNRVMGPILTANNNYQLIIKEGWKDQNGNIINYQNDDSWMISKSIRTLIDPDLWDIIVPEKETDALVIIGDRIMDEEIFNRLVLVKKNQNHINGNWKIESHKYIFVSPIPWEKDIYHITLPSHIEDVSGNTLSSAFDITEKMGVISRGEKVITFLIE